MIEYRLDVTAVTENDVEGFFDGWPSPPSASALLRVLRNSSHVVLAYDAERVVGLVNAISDGELAAYIPLLEVRATHRGRGIGAELVKRVTGLLADVYMIDAVCDDDVAPFYERIGFSRLNGMARRNRTARILEGT